MYMSGAGVERDPVTAYAWFILACDDRSMRNYVAGQTAKPENRLTPDQIAEAERLAEEWRAKIAAAKGAE